MSAVASFMLFFFDSPVLHILINYFYLNFQWKILLLLCFSWLLIDPFFLWFLFLWSHSCFFRNPGGHSVSLCSSPQNIAFPADQTSDLSGFNSVPYLIDNSKWWSNLLGVEPLKVEKRFSRSTSICKIKFFSRNWNC